MFYVNHICFCCIQMLFLYYKEVQRVVNPSIQRLEAGGSEVQVVLYYGVLGQSELHKMWKIRAEEGLGCKDNLRMRGGGTGNPPLVQLHLLFYLFQQTFSNSLYLVKIEPWKD